MSCLEGTGVITLQIHPSWRIPPDPAGDRSPLRRTRQAIRVVHEEGQLSNDLLVGLAEKGEVLARRLDAKRHYVESNLAPRCRRRTNERSAESGRWTFTKSLSGLFDPTVGSNKDQMLSFPVASCGFPLSFPSPEIATPFVCPSVSSLVRSSVLPSFLPWSFA